MLFNLNILVFDTVINQYVEGSIVIDLYVNNVADANANLFARDVMHLPIVENGISEYQKKYPHNGQPRWTAYTTPMYNHQYNVKCIYQESNDSTFSQIKKFQINIRFDTDSTHNPIDTQYFTCNNIFTAYEIAWRRFRLGKTPAVRNCQSASIDDTYIIAYSTNVDVARVVSIQNQIVSAIVNESPQSIIKIQANYHTQFHPILLFDDMLIYLFGCPYEKLLINSFMTSATI